MPCVHVFIRDQLSKKEAMPIYDGRTISGLPAKHTIEAKFEGVEGIKSVAFTLNGTTSIEGAAPYCHRGDDADLRLASGHYDLRVAAYAQAGGNGTVLIATQLRFKVIGETANQPPATTTGGRKIVFASGTLDGKTVKADELLDLGGKVWPIQSAPIILLGGMRNGGFNNQIPPKVSSDGKNKHGTEAVTIPATAKNVVMENITCVGDGYNGLLRCEGSQVVLRNLSGAKGLGWLAQLNGCENVQWDGATTRNLTRGGISLNQANKQFPRKITLSKLDLADGGNEAPLRINGGSEVHIRGGLADNSAASSLKDAVQLRGGDNTCVLEDFVMIHNCAGGQQPNGTPHAVEWTLRNCKLLGGYRFEAGWAGRVEGGTVVNRERVVFDGKEHQIGKTPDGKPVNYGGQAFSLQKAAMGLPKAACIVRNVVIDAAIVSGGIRPKFENCRDSAGKAII